MFIWSESASIIFIFIYSTYTCRFSYSCFPTTRQNLLKTGGFVIHIPCQLSPLDCVADCLTLSSSQLLINDYDFRVTDTACIAFLAELHRNTICMHNNLQIIMYTNPTGVGDVGGTENSSGDDADAPHAPNRFCRAGMHFATRPPQGQVFFLIRTSFWLGPRKGRIYVIYGYRPIRLGEKTADTDLLREKNTVFSLKRYSW
jgi:hypothetical protein